jgi:hypothetical protein
MLTADAAAISFDDFTAMNVRRVSGERVCDQPMQEVQPELPDATRKTKTKCSGDDEQMTKIQKDR